jgi:hypothetical protein
MWRSTEVMLKNHGPKPVLVALQLLPFLVVFISWFYLAIWNPVPYWQIQGDYSWYALSHAFTLESKSAGFPASNHGYNIHPGIPFGIASWVALRLATISIHGSAERIAYAVLHSEEFWHWAKLIALLLTLGGVLIIRRLFQHRLKYYLIACGAYLAAIPAVFSMSIAQLTNESFALIYMTGFYALIYIILVPTTTDSFGEATASKERLDVCAIGRVSRRDLISIALGVMAAFGCSIKIYYLAPAFGLFVGAMAACYVGTFSRKLLLRSAVCFALGFLFAGLVLVIGLIGWSSFNHWLNSTWQIISHSGIYGTGSKGFLRIDQSWKALLDITNSTRGAFPVIVGALIFLTCFVVIKKRHDRRWTNSYAPFATAVIIGISANLTGLLKHYSPLSQHYAIIVVASLPSLVLIISADRVGAKYLNVLSLLLPVFLLLTLSHVASTHALQLQNSAAVTRDIAIIDNLPLSQNERRVWGYFSECREGVVPLISQYAGSQFVTDVINRTIGTTDISPSTAPDAKNWRYVVFPKTYYPSRDSIATNYKAMFDFSPTKFVLSVNDKVMELERFFLLDRNLSAEGLGKN